MAGSSRDADVLIIGAGMAGLSTAWHLRDQRSVIVLEGRARKGGRIDTRHDFDGVTVELGANWIQSAEWNPLKKIADDTKIELLRWHFDDVALFDFDDRRLSDTDSAAVFAEFGAAIAEVEAYAAERKLQSKPDVSVADALDQVLADADADEAKRVRAVGAFAISDSLAAPMSDLSLYEWQDNTIGGIADFIPVRGYDTLIELLAEGTEVVLDATVEHIRHGDHGVIVTTSAGKYTGRRVVVTVPVGVLKQGDIEFDPPLPWWKCKHIENVKMGCENKLFFKFPESFWSSVGRANLMRMNGEQGWGAWHDLSAACGAPMLLALVSDKQAIAQESQPDEEVIDDALRILHRMFPAATIARPKMLRSMWVKDRFARGAYSHSPVHSTPADRLGLAAPVGNILFAGEATNRWAQSSVHGAFISGYREAQRILTGSAPEELPYVAPPQAHRPRSPIPLQRR